MPSERNPNDKVEPAERRFGVWIGVACFVMACATRSATEEDTGGDAGAAEQAVFVLADGEDEPRDLAIDDRYVYWTTPTALRRVPIAGGEVTTLATGEGMSHVVVSEGDVVFSDTEAGTVSRANRDGRRVERVGSGTRLSGLALTSDRVCWGDRSGGNAMTGSITCAALDGTDANTSSAWAPGAIAAGPDFVYFTSTSRGCSASSSGTSCSGGGVHRVPLSGGAAERVDEEDATHIVHGQRGAYWVRSSRARIKHIAHGDAQAEVLADLPREDAGPMAIDADALYLASNGHVTKIPLDGDAVQSIVTDLGAIAGIAVDEAWLYVAATDQGRILRVRKDGSATEPKPITGPCPDPVGSAADIAATPRTDENLELLALRLDSERVAATQATYDRVVADVMAVRAIEPAVADIDYFAPNDGKTLVISPSEAAYRSMSAKMYTAWDCLNDFYEMQSITLDESATSPWVLLSLEGRYNLDMVAAAYLALPGIESVSPNVAVGDASTICALRSGTRIEYVFDLAGGDCPSGCTTHDARYFVSSAAGVVEAKGRWRSERDDAMPEWFDRVCR